MHLRFVAGALAAMMVANPAFAQDVQLSPKQAEQLACIRDWLMDDGMDIPIADVYARGDTEGEDLDEVSDAMDEAMIGCQDQFDWSDEQTNLAAEIGMFQLILDVNSERLARSSGVTEASYQQIGAVLTAMTDADRTVLVSGGWRDDDVVLKRMSEQLIAAGIPRNGTILAYAFLMMEAKLVVTYDTADWVKLTP